jgi:hypothetical protein
MSTLVFILLVLFGLSLLCALLIISAAVVSSRSSKRLAAKGLLDPMEEAPTPTKNTSPSAAKHPDQTTTRMAI